MNAPTVIAVSRAEIENSACTLSNIIISIRSPGQRRAIVGGNNPVDCLFLEFNDIDKDGKIWTLHGMMSRDDVKDFDASMAKEVVDFVNKHKDSVEVIICQCEAGISRSSGTAAAVCAMLGQHQEDGEFWVGHNCYRPNTNVYKMITKAAGIKLFKGEVDEG